MISTGEKATQPWGEVKMDHAEKVAKLVVEASLPGASLEYHPEQSSGEYDFGLRFGDGSSAALEVTSSVDQAQVETIAAISNRKKGRSDIQAAQCKKSWIIFPMPSARINEIRNKIDEYLCKLELAGVETFSCIDDGPSCIQVICRDLQLRRGSVIPAVTPARIWIASPGGGGAVGANTAIEVGETEAWREDNRKKLGKARKDERHVDAPR